MRCGHPVGSAMSRGFTLLELLVALAVFAVMAAMAYRGLDTVLAAQEHTDAAAARLARIQKAVMLLQRDLEQAVNRPVRDELGDPLPAMSGGASGTAVLELTRGGHADPVGLNRSRLQRIAYRWNGSRLERRSWPVLDRSQGVEPDAAVLLHGVDAMRVRFLAREWHQVWPPPGRSNAFPRAVEVHFDVTQWGTVRRLVPLEINAHAAS